MRKKILSLFLALATSVGLSWATTNSITINASSHGSVVASASSAAAGETITLTATPDDGYQLKSISGVYLPVTETLNATGGTVDGIKFRAQADEYGSDAWKVYKPNVNTNKKLTISSLNGTTIITKIEFTAEPGWNVNNDQLYVSPNTATFSFDDNNPSSKVTINNINATSVQIRGGGSGAARTWFIKSVKVYTNEVYTDEVALEISDTEDANVKTFTMVDSDVTISAEFKVGSAPKPSWVRAGDDWDDGNILTVNSDLGYGAYQGQTEIEHVIISNSVTSIGQMAFDGCTGLKSVTIGDDVVTSIGDYAFYQCSALTSVTIGNSVTSIGEDAFEYCSALTSVTIPNSVTSIGQLAFHDCSGLTSVTIGNGVTSIGYATFADCSNLTSVTIGNSVTSIGWVAFDQCGLTSLTIPSSVTSIGKQAFGSCPLTSVTIDATTPPSVDKYPFRYLNLSAIKLYVPVSSASAYKEAAEWQNFYFHANPTAHEEPLNEGTYYSTFYDSDDIYLLPTGVEAYVATLSGSNLLLTKIAEAGEYIPKNCAVILKSTVESYDLFISKETPVSFSATNSLQGTDDAIETPSNCYVLSCENNQVGFYHYTAANLNAHKAYVVFSGSNQAPRRMPFIFEQENTTTGVENVQGNVQSTKVIENGVLYIIKNGVRYNAQGQIVK